ncbi:MAG TPA: hypothetical protein VGI81_23070 [Tepidisphaeraceae bacterium]|jgi:hypothetical protein
MLGVTCEFCGKAAVFVIREMEDGEARERHLCTKHALDLDLPPGTYILDNRAYPSFADLVAAVGRTSNGDLPRRSAGNVSDEPSLTASR